MSKSKIIIATGKIGDKTDEGIKVGDVVYAQSHYKIVRCRVTQVTRTIVTLDDGAKLNRNLSIRGDKCKWPAWTYHLPTLKLDEDYQRQELLSRIEKVAVSKLSLEKLWRIVAIMEGETE